MVCMASRSGRRAFSTRGRNAASTPKGTPIRTAMNTETPIKASVSMVGSHKPDQSRVDHGDGGHQPGTPVAIAGDHSKDAIGRTNQGTQSRASSIPVMAQSTAEVIGWKNPVKRR